MVKRAWRARGVPFLVSEFRGGVSPTAVLAAISQEEGLEEVLIKSRSINS